MKKVHITTLGCSKNIVDSEVLAGQLKLNKIRITDTPDKADIIIVNTCGFIEDAKKESIQAVFEAVNLKNGRENKKVYVAGCLSQRYSDTLKNEIPEIDAVFGTEDYQNILNEIVSDHYVPEKIYNYREISTPSNYAYIKISEGCNHTCSFCAIPHIRGKHRSRPIEDIMNEAEILAQRGVQELILVSQDTSYYGKDLYKKQMITKLLENISDKKWFRWIRPLYWYPANFPHEFIDMIGTREGIIPYLDMPVQHCSNDVLRAMRRAETYDKLYNFYSELRKKIPEIALRTTIILGHPGEKESDFKILKDFIKEIRFDRLGTFIYSDEEGTRAYQLEQKVDKSTATRRAGEIMEIQKDISLDLNRKLIGTTQQVLIEKYDNQDNYYSGRTYRDAPEIDNEVIIESEEPDITRIGQFVNVLVQDASEYELYGSFIVDII